MDSSPLLVGQRVASQFLVHERIFVSRDACHTYSPKVNVWIDVLHHPCNCSDQKIGQGMNASMKYLHNLGQLDTLVPHPYRALTVHVLTGVEDGPCSLTS